MIHGKRRGTAIAIAVTVVAAGVGTTLAVVPSSARSHHSASPVRVASENSMPGMAGMPMGSGTDVSDQSPGLDGGYPPGKPAYFAAVLRGADEVPVPNGPAVGDKDGIAVEFMRVQGNQVSFAIKWSGIEAPTAGHLHAGRKGVNGDVRIPFFAEKLPGSLDAVSGSVTVDDAELLSDLRGDPGGFYVNIHTGEFPGGALRAQVHKLTRPVDIGRALSSFPASVVRGKQSYACAKQADGSWKSTQNNTVGGVAPSGTCDPHTRPEVGVPYHADHLFVGK
jgi:CHRD domain